MLLSEIPRVKAGCAVGRQNVSLEDVEQQERALLAQRARDVLGYNGLAAEVSGDCHALVRPGKLAAALRELQIDVLDLGCVLDYQMEEMVRATREKIEQDNLDDWATGYFIEAGWGKTSLSEYRHPIPEFVLSTALLIKEKVPDVKFYVQHLRDAKADPFLVAAHGKEIYYVEAWDEPRFEGRARR